jgi:hypothetical protein
MKPTSVYELEMPREKAPAPATPGGELAIPGGEIVSIEERAYRKLLQGFRPG